MAIHFPKGEGIKIIRTESEATVNDTIYILPTDEKTAKVIIRSKSGKKRTVGITLPENMATNDLFDMQGSITEEGNVYLKTQVDKFISGLDSAVKELEPRVLAVENKNIAQDEALQAEVNARVVADENLKQLISTEATVREQNDNDIINTVNQINAIFNSKADLVNGKVPLEQLPFGDDVLNFDNFSAFPQTGEVGKFYVDLAEDKPFVWDAEGAVYKAASTTGNFANADATNIDVAVWREKLNITGENIYADARVKPIKLINATSEGVQLINTI